MSKPLAIGAWLRTAIVTRMDCGLGTSIPEGLHGKRHQNVKIWILNGQDFNARKSRKNEKGLHTWSFYRLSQFSEYKAK